MTLTHADTPILEHADSDFDAGRKRKLASLRRNVTFNPYLRRDLVDVKRSKVRTFSWTFLRDTNSKNRVYQSQKNLVTL